MADLYGIYNSEWSKGNKQSHYGNWIDISNEKWDNWFSRNFKFEYSLDYFFGVVLGNFPYFSPELYKANVADLMAQGSMNMTTTVKVELFEMARWTFTFDFAPFVTTMGAQAYTTSLIGDNCFWFYYSHNVMVYQTKVQKEFKNCANNLKGLM